MFKTQQVHTLNLSDRLSIDMAIDGTSFNRKIRSIQSYSSR